MKLYKKPVITLDIGIAEGIYAASGAGETNRVNFLRYDGDWGKGGTAVFNVDLSSLNPSQLIVVLTFNMDISNGWGGGSSATPSGKELTLTWYSAPTSAEISVQVQENDIKQLECTGFSYSNN